LPAPKEKPPSGGFSFGAMGNTYLLPITNHNPNLTRRENHDGFFLDCLFHRFHIIQSRSLAYCPNSIFIFASIVAKKLLTLPLPGDNISSLKRQQRCDYGGKEKAAMKKNCFMMMAMMMRMCGMRTFSDATFSDSSIITD